MILYRTLGIRACEYKETSCFIDQSDDQVLHDTSFGDGPNLYQLDNIQRCLSEFEIGNFLHEFEVASANNINPTHVSGCGDNAKDINRAFDKRAWEVFGRRVLKNVRVGKMECTQ